MHQKPEELPRLLPILHFVLRDAGEHGMHGIHVIHVIHGIHVIQPLPQFGWQSFIGTHVPAPTRQPCQSAKLPGRLARDQAEPSLVWNIQRGITDAGQ